MRFSLFVLDRFILFCLFIIVSVATFIKMLLLSHQCQCISLDLFLVILCPILCLILCLILCPILCPIFYFCCLRTFLIGLENVYHFILFFLTQQLIIVPSWFVWPSGWITWFCDHFIVYQFVVLFNWRFYGRWDFPFPSNTDHL